MAKAYQIYIWKKAPFIRLALALIAGIILEFYLKFSLSPIISAGLTSLFAFILFSILPEAYKYKFRPLQGIIISCILIVLGLFITWQKDIRNHDYWYGNYYSDSSFVVARIDEPPVEKEKSYKALASVESIINETTLQSVKGKILLYFAKDSIENAIHYGDQIIIGEKLQAIKNSGNPGSFNYAQYSAFHQLYHQCYLKKTDWVKLKAKNANAFSSLLISIRKKVVKIIDSYISGKEESSIAKALLIGYKADLDKDLIQAYSNAGVVHLIAISGLHLGIIYGILFGIFSIIPIINKSKIARMIFILTGLWLFAILTGASSSVLRAAVMFSFIVTGNTINKHGSVYNSLAASAFILLCYNPFLLWDVGFQLSYLAVLGIVIAQPHIANWFYFKNKILQKIWQFAALSVAAQLFTFPVCLYYFHQFPLLFLLTNIFAIPLVMLILPGLLLLVLMAPLPVAALYWGKCIFGLLWLLNQSVLFINSIPFSLWQGFSVSTTEVLLLYGIVFCFVYSFLHKNKTAFTIAITFSLLFTSSTIIKKWKRFRQEKMIVYNIPYHQAIDFITRDNFFFVGDADLLADNMLRNFHLKPSRISFMANKRSGPSNSFFRNNNFYEVSGKKIALIDTALNYLPMEKKMAVDYIIISKNPKLTIFDLAQIFDCNYYIFDASNTLWKIDEWKKECEELHLHFHSVYEQGAFVTDL
ncbi:MAG: ComEC/Rec2 family competence protein [Bacteroidota bacterium]|nr:ComEC/Rec2 family competence protein [Bacteroidota bacterium]